MPNIKPYHVERMADQQSVNSTVLVPGDAELPSLTVFHLRRQRFKPALPACGCPVDPMIPNLRKTITRELCDGPSGEFFKSLGQLLCVVLRKLILWAHLVVVTKITKREPKSFIRDFGLLYRGYDLRRLLLDQVEAVSARLL